MKISRNFKLFSPSNSPTPIQRAIKNLYNNPYHLKLEDYGHLLQFCANHRLIRVGKQLHTRLLLNNFTIDNFIGSKLINFYSRNDHLENARKVFDEIRQRNTWSYNAMLIAYSCHDEEIETLRLYSSFVRGLDVGFKPDNFSVTCVLKAISSLFFYVDLGREIHCYGLRNGFDSDLFAVNGLITYYARCDEVGLARKVFDSMKKRDLVSWNSMISGYAQGGYDEDCLKLFNSMLYDGKLRPDDVTVASVLQACAQKNDLVKGMEVHQFVIEKNIGGSILLCNAIIGLYARCGKLDYARELFEQMSEKDEVTYGCMIAGYFAYGYVDKATELFRSLERPSLSTWNCFVSGMTQNNFKEVTFDLVREMQVSGFRPNSVTITSLLSALSGYFDLKGDKEVHAYAIRNNLVDNIYVTTGMIDVYGKAGFLEGARQVFDRSRHRSVVVWTAIIAAYEANADANHALILFEDMLNSGTKPDTVTLTTVLTACAQLGNMHQIQKILEDLDIRFGIQPAAEHYGCVVRVLMQAGKLSEIEEFIHKMPLGAL